MMNKPLLFACVAIFSIAVTACTSHKGKDNGVTLSGTITASSGSVTDSDVNDSFAPYAANDNLAQAQSVPNPVTIGGFVAMPGQVQTLGRLAGSAVGDIDDYYSLALLQGQVVNLTISDREGANFVNGIGEQYVANNASFPGNDIDLHLLDSNGLEVAVATIANGDPSLKSVTAPATANYYLWVEAKTGASDYAINTGLSGLQTTSVAAATAPSNGVANVSANVGNIDEEFVPGEVIVDFKRVLLPASTAAAHTLASRAASLGLQPKAGAEGRSMLMSLGDSAQQQKAIAALNINIAQQYSDPRTQLKYETLEVVKALRSRADVQSARLNYIRHATAVPNDTYYGYQWHYDLINLPQAWDVTNGSASVIAAVIDTGILENHPDLAGNIISNGSGGIGGYDFISDPANSGDGDGIDANPHDEGDGTNGPSSFHGTHVAGTIAAVTDNSRGVAGVGWNVKIMPLRVLGKLGGSDYDIEQAILYAARLSNDSGTLPAQKADVINLSLGGATNSTTPPNAFVQARNAGVIIVAAAGNDASSAYSYPASLEGVVSVSAVDINKKIAFYSNFGSTVDVAAPGGDTTVDINGDSYPDGVLSTWADDSSGTPVLGYGFLQGTSMASPHVAGVAALMKSVALANGQDLTPAIFDTLLASGDITEDLGATGRDDSYGYGLIDAYKAVQAVSATLPAVAPAAAVSPKTLIFQNTETTLQFSVANNGGGSLTVALPASNTLPAWLTVTPQNNVDPGGLGTYDVIVDRGLMPSNDPTVGTILTLSYTATVNSTVTSGSLNIPLMVYQRDFVPDAGYQYVLLFDASLPNWWENAVRMASVGLSNGKYFYRLTNVPPGQYYINGGSDLNANNVVCDVGETCGYYPIYGRLQQITVPDATSDIQGLDFSVGYNLLISNNHVNNPAVQSATNTPDGVTKRSAIVPVSPQMMRERPVFLP